MQVIDETNLHKSIICAPLGICFLNGPDLLFEVINPAYHQFSPGRKLNGRRIFEALPELEGTQLQKDLLNVFITGEPYAIKDLPIPAAAHEAESIGYRYFNYTYQVRRDEHHIVDGIMVYVYEVTDSVIVRQEQLALNAEFQSMNEEYLATNEELSASNEELSAVNEELYASNEELTQTQEHLLVTNQALEASESQLKIAFETVVRSEKLFHSIASNMPKSLIIVIDRDHRYLTVAGGIMEQMGYERIDYKGKHPLEAGPSERYEASKVFYERVLSGEQYFIERQAATGEQLLVHFVPLKNEQNEVEAALIIAIDITEIKQAEERSARLAAIIESSDDAIISKTLDSVIISWNHSAQRMFGYTADEIIGQTIYILIPPDRLDEEPKILARLENGERVEHFETKRLTKDGRQLDVSLTISPVRDPQGKIIGLSKIMRDITERKQDEVRKNDFIGMVSHELKTPLTSLTALVQLAHSKLKSSEDPFLAVAMHKANSQVKRMSTMINGFLDLSRFESGKIHMEKQRFSLSQLLREVVEETKLIVSSHEVSLIDNAEVEIYADREKISSVISNLISNAIKYSPKGKLVQVTCRLEDSNVILSVKDEGMGIKPTDIGQIFDRYYRVQTDHTRNIAGFGIGLYLSAEIIKRHNGRIWAESESGIGSTFCFSLSLSVLGN